MLIWQTNSAQQVLCDDSCIGVYHPQTACVSTINRRHAPCLGKQAPRLTTAAKAPLLTLWAAFTLSLLLMLYFVIKTSKFCVTPTHLKQSAPLCNVMAFQCCDIIRMHPCMFLYICVCVCIHSTPMLTAQLRSRHHPQKCVDMPPLDKEALFYSPWGRIGFYKPLIIWGTQRHI